MKLLTIMPHYWPAFEFGGPIYCIHDLNKALARKGIDVSVYTTNAGLGDKVESNVPVDVDGVKVTYFEVNKVFEALGETGWQFSMSLTKALKNNIKSFDFIYIVYVWNYTVAAASYFARKNNIPYIISPVGALYPGTRSHKFWKKLPYYKLISEKDIKRASAIHYTTPDEAEKCHNALSLGNSALVVPNGINLEDFSNLPPRKKLKECFPHLRGKKVILFLGRISWIKGLDILITAFAELHKREKEVHLLIVGNDEEGYALEIKELISDLGLEYIDLGLNDGMPGKISNDEIESASITFTGMLTGDKKLEAFTGSDIFVLSSYSENFGMAVIEAMICETPVIISNNVGIYREIEANNAGVVIENNATELTRAMDILIKNDNHREELRDTGKKFVSEYFNILNVADRMIESYKEIIKEHNKGIQKIS